MAYIARLAYDACLHTTMSVCLRLSVVILEEVMDPSGFWSCLVLCTVSRNETCVTCVYERSSSICCLPSHSLTILQLGVDLADPLAAMCAQFLQRFKDEQNVELEGKLGKLIMRPPQTATFRVDPVVSPCVLNIDPRKAWRFEPGVENLRYERILDLLEKRCKPQRVLTIDSFYNVAGEHVRVSRERGSNKVLACIIKKRIENGEIDMILDPATGAAVRVSVRSEAPTPMPPADAQPTEFREKDRRTFRIGILQFDVTKTFAWASHAPTVRTETNEVEVEVAPEYVKALFACARESAEKRTDQFLSYIKGFVDVLRGLHYLSLASGQGVHVFVPTSVSSTNVLASPHGNAGSDDTSSASGKEGSSETGTSSSGTASLPSSTVTGELGVKRVRPNIVVGDDEDGL